MITIKPQESVINKPKIYKQSLLDNCEYKEWAIKKTEQFGSVKQYLEQRESADDYFKQLGWN